MIGRQVNDSIEGERVVCICRKINRERLIAGSHAHRAMELVVEGTPVKCFVLKPVRAL